MDFNVSSIADVASSMYSTLKTVVNIVLPIIIGVVLLIGLIYSIYLGIKYAKAEEADDRNKQKQHLVGAVTGFAITLVLIAIINVVLAVVVDNKIKAQQDELNTAIAAIQAETGTAKKYATTGGGHTENDIKTLTIGGQEIITNGNIPAANKQFEIAGYTVKFVGIKGVSESDKIAEETNSKITVHFTYEGATVTFEVPITAE